MTASGASVRTWILLGCAGILVLTIIGGGTFTYFVFRTIRMTDPYQMAVAELRRSAEGRAALGEPIAEGFFTMGTVNVAGPAGEAKLSIPVHGPKGEGTLNVEGVKQAGAWTITLLKLDPPSGAHIDLLPGAQLAAMERSCAAGNAGDCNTLGIRFTTEGAGKDLTRAIAFYEKGCGADFPPACGNLGSLYMGYPGVAEDAPRAASLLARGCTGGVAIACSNLGVMYQRGWGVAKDPARSATLYQQGCDGGYALGCINLAELHVRGTGVPKDHARAAALFDRACKAGDTAACQRLNEAKP